MYVYVIVNILSGWQNKTKYNIIYIYIKQTNKKVKLSEDKTSAKFCGDCHGTFEMSGSSAIRP